MASKDSKRIVRTYNRVAKALIEFETLWVQAWIRSIESAKAGLQSTLIVRHPTSGTDCCQGCPCTWLPGFCIMTVHSIQAQHVFIILQYFLVCLLAVGSPAVLHITACH